VIIHKKTADKSFGYFSLGGDRVFLEQDNSCGPVWGVLPADYAAPNCLPQAIEAARRLNRGIDYAGCDFMTDGRDLYAGEVAVYPGSGITAAGNKRAPNSNSLIERHWDLRKSWFLRERQPGKLGLYADLLHSVLDDEAADDEPPPSQPPHQNG
jgi:hypothetical protein